MDSTSKELAVDHHDDQISPLWRVADLPRKCTRDGEPSRSLVEGSPMRKRETTPTLLPTLTQSSFITKPSPIAQDDLTHYLKKIALSPKTTFQKRVLTLLCQVPRGKYSTYGALAKYMASSPRAVGNALRNNPFAPQVPCHRILASGGGIGGFHGSWGRGGEKGLHDEKKRRLLREEGVRFDGKGRVVGRVWDDFR